MITTMCFADLTIFYCFMFNTYLTSNATIPSQLFMIINDLNYILIIFYRIQWRSKTFFVSCKAKYFQSIIDQYI